MMSSELTMWTNSPTATLEERKTALESSREPKGGHRDESTGVFDSAVE